MKLTIEKELNQINNFKKSEEIEVKEIKLEIGNITLCITEHQLGLPLNKPYINIITDSVVYSMDLDAFINKGIS